MAITTSHFEVTSSPAVVRRIPVPGYTGPITKKLVGELVQIRQFGLCDANDETAVTANKGDPSTTTTVDTLGKGSYANCYKVEARLLGPSRTGTQCQYEILWQQLTS